MNERRAGAKRITRKIAHALVGAAFLATATIAAASASGLKQGPGFNPPVARIDFTDGSGASEAAPQLQFTAAYPGMAPERVVVHLRNVGEHAEAYTVSSQAVATGGHSLDHVLLVSVRDLGSGAVVYNGKISGLSFHAPSVLAPGGAASYAFVVRWPETGNDDNAFEGQALSFGLRAQAATVSA